MGENKLDIPPLKLCNPIIISSEQLKFSFFSLKLIFFLIYFFLFVVDFVIHWNETAKGLHVFPIPIPPPTSLSTHSL